MKTLFTLYFMISLIPLHAEEAPPIATISDALRTGKIAKLELDKATFEQALALVRAEWQQQYPALDFPVSLAEYERDQGHPPLITMSLRNVPFIKALQYIGQTSQRRLIKKPDLLTFEEVGLIVADWNTRSHPTSEEVLTSLGLGKQPTSKELASAYAKYGVEWEDWMKIDYNEGFLIVTAKEPQQEQIAGINFLLSRRYKIIKDEQDDAGQSATRPDSKTQSKDKPQPEVEGRSR